MIDYRNDDDKIGHSVDSTCSGNMMMSLSYLLAKDGLVEIIYRKITLYIYQTKLIDLDAILDIIKNMDTIWRHNTN